MIGFANDKYQQLMVSFMAFSSSIDILNLLFLCHAANAFISSRALGTRKFTFHSSCYGKCLRF